MHGTATLFPGGAVLTSAGRLPYKGIIHVAGINMLWVSSDKSIVASTKNAIGLAKENGFKSMALPLIGAGTGGGKAEHVLNLMSDVIGGADFDGEVVLVKFHKK